MTITFDLTAAQATDVVNALSKKITQKQAGIIAGDTNVIAVKKYILANIRRDVINNKQFEAGDAAAKAAIAAVTTDIPVQ